ncbi:stalk domain-containing protein [Paenibacillus kobensis]|uniref:stalk domain-containing protein n=1 Tax=Paenibacillus kobensis TaxID=59841 RepID=UPI000FD74E5B|nr:stalk domain-containing protein [Paenibacillus kobensis]
MKQWFNKKVMIAVTATAVLTSIGAVAYAGSTVKKIQAYQNAGISIKVDGTKVNLADGKEQLYPIVYNGRTYIPAAPVMEALGGSVAWNGSTSSVDITSAGSDDSAAIPTKDAGTSSSSSSSNDGATVSTGATSFPQISADAKSADIYETLKPIASYLIQVYADALKTGKDDKMDTWLKANVGKSEYGNYYYEDSLKEFNKSIEGYRDSYDATITTPIANSAINKAKALNFNDDSDYMDGKYSRDFEYFVDVEGANHHGQIGIYFFVNLNEETNQYYLSSVNFY